MNILLFCSLLGIVFANNSCNSLKNGTYCVEGNIIKCEYHTETLISKCPLKRSNGCKDLFSCECVSNWKGILCNECPSNKTCNDNLDLEWWEILLIISGTIVALYIIGFAIYACMALNGFPNR